MIGVIEETDNTEKREEAEKSSYYRVVVFDKKRSIYSTLLLTHSDFQRVLTRGLKNPEDNVKPSWFQRLIHWFIR